MKKTLLTAFLVLIYIIPAVTEADDKRAREIIEKVDARDDGESQVSDMEMILIDKSNNKRTRIMRAFSKDFGEDRYRIMFFLKPSNVKDTAFLTYDYDDPVKDDDQWLYLPALKKTKRIASSDKSNSFMGSDFSYADMTERDPDNYDFKLLKEVKVGEHDAWLIESIPRNEKVIDEYGYTKSIVYVRKDNYFVIRAVNLVKDGNKLKYMDVKNLEKIDGVWVATEIHMTTKKNKRTLHKTIMKHNNIRMNEKLDDDFFTVRQLEKGK